MMFGKDSGPKKTKIITDFDPEKFITIYFSSSLTPHQCVLPKGKIIKKRKRDNHKFQGIFAQKF